MTTIISKVEEISKLPYLIRYQRCELLGAVGVYSMFTKRFADIVTPSFQLLRSRSTWNRGTEQQIAFDKLKTAVASAPVLEAPNFDLGLELATDASGYGLGAVLQQRHPNGDVQPILFASRSLTPTKTSYITQEQECLAVAFGILKFEVYLTKRQTVHRSDWPS